MPDSGVFLESWKFQIFWVGIASLLEYQHNSFSLLQFDWALFWSLLTKCVNFNCKGKGRAMSTQAWSGI